MPAKVADTSVLAALIYGEPQSQQAEFLLAEAELFEPPLLSYELATVCRAIFRTQSHNLRCDLPMGVSHTGNPTPYLRQATAGLDDELTTLDNTAFS